MRELGRSGVQSKLKKMIVAAGGWVEHHTSPGRRGVPDLIVSWPSSFINEPATVHFVETKTKGGVLSEGQKRDHAARRAAGMDVRVIWNVEQARQYVEMYQPLTFQGVPIKWDVA